MFLKIYLNKDLVFQDIEKLKSDECLINVFTSLTSGRKSHLVTLEIQSSKHEDSIIQMDFNKNEALYLCNFLKSFINEKNINTDDED